MKQVMSGRMLAATLLLSCAIVVPVLAGPLNASRDTAAAAVAAAKGIFDRAAQEGRFANEASLNAVQARVKLAESLPDGIQESAYHNDRTLARALVAGSEAMASDITDTLRGVKPLKALPGGSIADVEAQVGGQLAQADEAFRKARMAGKFKSLGEISAAREKLAHAAVLLEDVGRQQRRGDETQARALMAAANVLIAQVEGAAGGAASRTARRAPAPSAAKTPKSDGPRVVSVPGSTGLQLSDRFPEFALE